MATPSMAQIRLQPPELFNFKQPDDWSHWKRRFEQFGLASGIDTDPAVKQVSTFAIADMRQRENISEFETIPRDGQPAGEVFL